MFSPSTQFIDSCFAQIKNRKKGANTSRLLPTTPALPTSEGKKSPNYIQTLVNIYGRGLGPHM